MNGYKLTHAVLNDVAKKVPQDENVMPILADMLHIMRTNNGIGLAAPQIGLSKRIIITTVKGKPQVIINPEIVDRRLGSCPSKEGCLSFPGLRKTVRRSKMVIVKGFNEKWEPVKYKVRGIDSMCVQHEIDHLNGITLKNRK